MLDVLTNLTRVTNTKTKDISCILLFLFYFTCARMEYCFSYWEMSLHYLSLVNETCGLHSHYKQTYISKNILNIICQKSVLLTYLQWTFSLNQLWCGDSGPTMRQLLGSMHMATGAAHHALWTPVGRKLSNLGIWQTWCDPQFQTGCLVMKLPMSCWWTWQMTINIQYDYKIMLTLEALKTFIIKCKSKCSIGKYL